jgi:hypothetical protein
MEASITRISAEHSAISASSPSHPRTATRGDRRLLAALRRPRSERHRRSTPDGVALLTPRAVAIVLANSPPPCMRMLGHTKASMTLDTSADPFDEDLDKVADASEQSIWRDSRWNWNRVDLRFTRVRLTRGVIGAFNDAAHRGGPAAAAVAARGL